MKKSRFTDSQIIAVLKQAEQGDALQSELFKLEAEVPAVLAALQALQALTDAVPAAHLDAYRRAVVQALGRPHRGVDDAVRAVRTAAVDCRAAWYATQE